MTINSCKPDMFFRENQHLAGEGIPRVVLSSGKCRVFAFGEESKWVIPTDHSF